MTALDQNFSDLASLMMQRRQMQAQQAQQDRANRLSDLQYKQLQREDNYQTGLQGAMSAAKPDATVTSVIPKKPQLSLAALGGQLQPPQFQPAQGQASPLVQAYHDGRIQTATVKGKTPAQAGAEYALSQGRVDDAVKMFSVDDAVAQLQAKGDLQDYYKAKQELDQGAKFFEVLKPYKNNPAALEQVWPQIQRMFPNESEGINPKSIGADANGMFAPLVVNGKEVPNRVVYHDDDGKTHIVDVTPKEQGKPFSREYDEGNTRITELYDGSGKLTDVKRAPRYKPAAAGNGRGGQGGGVAPKPGKALPASTLTDLNEASQMIKTLKEAQDIAKRVNTGPIAGRFQSAGQLVGVTSEDFSQFKQKLASVNNAMLKLRSGAAVTESEYNRFLQEMPTANDDEKVRDTKLANATAYMEGLLAGKVATFEEGGYKVPSGVLARSTPSPTTTSQRGPAQPTKNNKPIVTKGGFKVTRVP